MIYIALLRGVNVGGKGIVRMADLKICFENLGFTRVKTYINSGNVIFEAQPSDTSTLARRIEEALDVVFDPGIRVLVRTHEELERLANAIPTKWVNDSTTKCDVMFLWPEIDKQGTLTALLINPDIEEGRYFPGAIIWYIDRSHVTKSRVPRIIGTKTYKQMTIRNVNTVRKLLALANEAN